MRIWAFCKIVLFTSLVPGVVVGVIPYRLLNQQVLLIGYIHDIHVGTHLLGILPILMGLGLYVWCVWTFWSLGRGTPAPIDPPKELVVQGPYGIVRNPMYEAVFLILIGEAIFFVSIPLLKFFLLFALVIALLVRFYEEPLLRRRFGDAYRGYNRSVGRWLPRLNSRVGRKADGGRTLVIE